MNAQSAIWGPKSGVESGDNLGPYHFFFFQMRRRSSCLAATFTQASLCWRQAARAASGAVRGALIMTQSRNLVANYLKFGFELVLRGAKITRYCAVKLVLKGAKIACYYTVKVESPLFVCCCVGYFLGSGESHKCYRISPQQTDSAL